MSKPKNHKPGSLAIGPLSPSGTGSHYAPKRIDFEPVTRICTASSRELLTDYAGQLARTELRKGCKQAAGLPSRGTGC